MSVFINIYVYVPVLLFQTVAIHGKCHGHLGVSCSVLRIIAAFHFRDVLYSKSPAPMYNNLNLVPNNFIWFHIKVKGRTITSINSCTKWFIGVVNYSILTILNISMNFSIRVCTKPSMKKVFTICCP